MAKSAGRKRNQPSHGTIVSSVAKYYLESRDFNGFPVRAFFSDEQGKEATRAALQRLVRQGKITMEFGTRHPNPYIKAFQPPSKSKQIEELEANDLMHACAYPTHSVLSKRVKAAAQDEPFTRRLMLGEPQLEFHSFDLSILEFYRNDPRYAYETDDIRGS